MSTRTRDEHTSTGRERGFDNSRERNDSRSLIDDHRSYRQEDRHDNSHRRRSRSRHRSPVREREDRGRRGSRSRSRSRSRSAKHHEHGERHKRRRSHSASSSSSEDDPDRKHKKKRSEKRRHRSSRSRERKEKRKEKKEKKKKKAGAVTSQWGKYGIISETDLYNKEEEFRAWLVEECKVNPETISKDQTKKQFARFVEDYNTATLPHEKFYNMQRYEARMSLLRNGEFVPQGDEDTYDPNADMQAHSSAHKRTVVEHESYLNKDQLKDLRRVQHERVEIAKRKQLGLEIKQSLGVRMDGNMFDE
ncbi:hypothetical protein K439DRAFT_1417109 [Ramaria rubella]|nr:hypothetical protein K439DRAFT_1417109 [Ramaria rubella]